MAHAAEVIRTIISHGASQIGGSVEGSLASEASDITVVDKLSDPLNIPRMLKDVRMVVRMGDGGIKLYPVVNFHACCNKYFLNHNFVSCAVEENKGRSNRSCTDVHDKALTSQRYDRSGSEPLTGSAA